MSDQMKMDISSIMEALSIAYANASKNDPGLKLDTFRRFVSIDGGKVRRFQAAYYDCLAILDIKTEEAEVKRFMALCNAAIFNSFRNHETVRTYPDAKYKKCILVEQREFSLSFRRKLIEIAKEAMDSFMRIKDARLGDPSIKKLFRSIAEFGNSEGEKIADEGEPV